MSNTWPGGYQAAVTVKNGSAMISSWKTSFALPSGGAVQSGWSGTYSQSGSTVTVSNAAWNGLLGCRRVHHLRLRGQRHRAELLDRGELHRQLIAR